MWASFHFVDGGGGWTHHRTAFLEAYAGSVKSPTRHVVTRDGGLLSSHGPWFALKGEGMFLRAPWCTLPGHDYLQRIADTEVFVITASGATLSQVRAVHLELRKDPAYIGALEVDPADGPQWVIYIDSFQHRFRVWGSRLTLLHTVGDELFDNQLEPWRALGLFEEVEFESIGALGTPFDSRSGPDHSALMGHLEDRMVDHLGGTASAVVARLSHLEPGLPEELSAAYTAIERCTTPANARQVATSVREFMVLLADALLPAESGKTRSGHELTRGKWLNRLAEFIERRADGADPSLLQSRLKLLGPLLNELGHDSSNEVHSPRPDRQIVATLLAELLVICDGLLSLVPPQVADVPISAKDRALLLDMLRPDGSAGVEAATPPQAETRREP